MDISHKVWCLSFILLCSWEIWKARCYASFRFIPLSPAHVIDSSIRLLTKFLDVYAPPSASPWPLVSSTAASRWSAPPLKVVKVNVDGAWSGPSKVAGIGVVIRDHAGSFVAPHSQHCVLPSAAAVEAKAAVVGLMLASSLGIQNIILESDSQVLISSLNCMPDVCDWRIFPFLDEIRRLRSSFNQCSWGWICREANGAADAAAKLAKWRLCFCNWVDTSPPSLVSVLSRDGLPAPPPPLPRCRVFSF